MNALTTSLYIAIFIATPQSSDNSDPPRPHADLTLVVVHLRLPSEPATDDSLVKLVGPGEVSLTSTRQHLVVALDGKQINLSRNELGTSPHDEARRVHIAFCGNVVYYCAPGIWERPYLLTCKDLSANRIVWTTKVLATHSPSKKPASGIVEHFIEMRVDERLIQIEGSTVFQTYLETFDSASGTRRSSKLFHR